MCTVTSYTTVRQALRRKYKKVMPKQDVHGDKTVSVTYSLSDYFFTYMQDACFGAGIKQSRKFDQIKLCFDKILHCNIQCD